MTTFAIIMLRNTPRNSAGPRYRLVKSRVIALIQTLKPGDRLPSVRSLITDAGVSHNTVVKAMEELEREGYVDLHVGRGAFVSSRPRPVEGCPAQPGGTLVYAAPEWHGHAIWSLGNQITLMALRSGRRVLPWRFFPGTTLDALTDFLPSVPDLAGVIVLPTANGCSPAHWRRLMAHGVPVVSLAPTLPGSDVPVICADPRATGSLLAQHLLDLGHRRIAFLQTQPASSITLAMIDGARSAVQAAGLPAQAFAAHESAQEDFADPLDAGIRLARVAIAQTDRPTGLICTSGISAIAAIRSLSEARLRVPADLSVIGISDEPLFAHLVPSLSATHIDHALVASRAMAVISGAPDPDPTIPVSIIARESTAAPAAV